MLCKTLFTKQRKIMKVKDLVFISNLDRWEISNQLNITYSYLSEIRNERINTLTKDLRLKIELFIIRNDLKDIVQKYTETFKKSYRVP